MKETRKLRILTKANGVYKTYTPEQLEFEAKLIEAKLKDIQTSQTKIEGLLEKWEKRTSKNIKLGKAVGIMFGTAFVVGIATFLATQGSPASAELSILASGLGVIAGLANAVSEHFKIASDPIARAYSKILGDKAVILGEKQSMVSALISANQIQQKVSNIKSYEEGTVNERN